MVRDKKNQKNQEVSELFISIEGEGPYTGTPTLYIRYARCNFTCAKFNNPENLIDSKHYAVLNFEPKNYSKLEDLPLIERGCDSQYSVNPEFSHLWKKLTTDELVEELMKLLPEQQWIHPKTRMPYILSLTGGEPTLRQKQIIELLNHPLMKDCQHILFETNCSVPLRDEFINALNGWWHPGRKITFANSPKLSASGEPWEKAIKPSVALQQQLVKRAEQYFKFVCGPNQQDFDEVERAMEQYWGAGVNRENNVYIMPTACINEQQDNIAAQVARMCIERGLRYCHRVHLDVFNNLPGT